MNVKFVFAAVACVITLALASSAKAAEIKVLTAGAYKQVVVALQPDFEKRTGHKLTIDNDTVGALAKRIDGGEAFDVVVVTPAALDDLGKKGKLAEGAHAVLARVGVGVMVRDGAPRPDVGSVEAFKKAVLDAKTVAYIDPASGGSSGIYVDRLFQRLGIADQIKPKARLKKGGYVADLIVSGEAELGIHQISEIVPVKGVTLVGPLPAEIQNYTTYAGGVGASAKDPDAAKALVQFLAGEAAAPILKSKGMDAPSS
jgi:molybdate transport system substrate-binding protein